MLDIIKPEQYTPIKDLNKSIAGEKVCIRARIHNTRSSSKKSCFLLLRQGFYFVQATIFSNEQISTDMVKYASKATKESIVEVFGIVTAVDTEITSATQKDIELSVTHIYTLSEAQSQLPLLVEDAMESDYTAKVKQEQSGKVVNVPNQEVRLDHRVLDTRAPAHIGIFRIQSAVGQFFREFLTQQGFIEIHTPKLIGAASEGGADVFQVKYFGGNAYLAQSPQLYKQMSVVADLMKVFEIGPVFRAENSNTHRHLTEFVGLDLEMTIARHYYEVLDVLNDMFVYIFDNLKTKCARELEAIQQQYPFEPIQYEGNTGKKNLRISYPDAIKYLREDGVEIGDLDDINTENEKRLGRVVKQKFGTDFFMLDRFPMNARPFYTMPCKDDSNYSNSYDLFLRGEEIASGAQRIHDPELLMQIAKQKKVDTTPIQAYVDSFKYGSYPHGGAGIGLERVVMLYLGIGNVRKVSQYPRDPKRLTP